MIGDRRSGKASVNPRQVSRLTLTGAECLSEPPEMIIEDWKLNIYGKRDQPGQFHKIGHRRRAETEQGKGAIYDKANVN